MHYVEKRCIRLATLFLGVVALSPAQQVAITDYIESLYEPNQIAVGPDGALWFTSGPANQIGRMTAAGTRSSAYDLPNVDSYPSGIVAGPDGALWFAEMLGNRIGRITTDGTITEYAVPTANSDPDGITRAPDGTLWFTENGAHRIGRITAAGAITEYFVNTTGGPAAITVGPDNALWFTETYASEIGQITMQGKFTEYPVPFNNDSIGLGGIAAGPDGAIWVTEFWQDAIGRITTAGVVTQYTLPTYDSGPDGIAVGPDGALWFAEFNGNAIGRITTGGVMTEYPVPATHDSQDPHPNGIVLGPDRSLWFTENASATIGQVVLPAASLTVNPPTDQYGSDLTFSGSMFAPNETVTIYKYGFGSAALVTASADAGGSFTVAAPAPQGIAGPRLFLCVGDTSRLQGAANFNVAPRIVLTPKSGAPGSTALVQGFGFGPNSPVLIDWNGKKTQLGSVTADLDGTFAGAAAVTVTIPLDANPGINQVVVQGVSPKVKTEASFTVE